MSKIEVNTIDTISGSTTMTIGSTNTSTIVMPNGALSGQNYPMFQVYRNADLAISDITNTQVTYTTVDYDTNNGWDSTNNKYVVPTGKGGKYYISNTLLCESGAASQLSQIFLYTRINGTTIATSNFNYENNHGRKMHPFTGVIYDCVAGDEIDALVWINVTSGSPTIRGASNDRQTYLSAYRLGA